MTLHAESPHPEEGVLSLRRRIVWALGLLLLMLYPHSGALGLASAPLLLLCVHAFVRVASALRQPASDASRQPALDERQLLRGLALLLAALQLLRSPGDALLAGTSGIPHRVLALLLAGIALRATRAPQGKHPRGSGILAAVAVLATGAVFAYLLMHAPSPRIDVFLLQQRGAAILACGQNPYSALYPNPYDPVETTAFFGHYSATLNHYPYPPVSLLLTALMHRLTGDVRWLFLLAHLGVAGALYWLGRCRTTLQSQRLDLGLALACIHLLHPRGFLVVEQAWTEPLVAGTTALWVLFRAHHSSGNAHSPTAPPTRWALATDSALLGLALSCKQYALLLLTPYLCRPLFAWMSPPWLQRLRSLGLSLLPLLVGYLIFAIWQPGDFLEDVVLFQLKQPFRSEALSLPALLAAVSDIRLPGGIAAMGMLLPLAYLGIAHPPHLPRGLGGQLLLFSLMLFGFFVSAKQAFCNYYYLVGVLLLLTLTQLGVPSEPNQGT